MGRDFPRMLASQSWVRNQSKEKTNKVYQKTLDIGTRGDWVTHAPLIAVPPPVTQPAKELISGGTNQCQSNQAERPNQPLHHQNGLPSENRVSERKILSCLLPHHEYL